MIFGITNPKGYPVSVAMFTALLAQHAGELGWGSMPALLAAAFAGFLLADLILVWLVGLPVLRRFYRRRELAIVRITGAMFVGFAVQAVAHGLPGVIAVLVLFVVIKVVDDTVIQPLTIGRSVHLHPAILLGSVVVGNHTLGVLGMIIAVPVATIVQETVRLLLQHRRTLARRGLRSSAERLVG